MPIMRLQTIEDRPEPNPVRSPHLLDFCGRGLLNGTKLRLDFHTPAVTSEL